MDMEASARRIKYEARNGLSPGQTGRCSLHRVYPCLRCTRGRLAGDLPGSRVGSKSVRSVVLFALIASVACTAAPRTPGAAATLAPAPTLRAVPIPSPVSAPDPTLPTLGSSISIPAARPTVTLAPLGAPLPSVGASPNPDTASASRDHDARRTSATDEPSAPAPGSRPLVQRQPPKASGYDFLMPAELIRRKGHRGRRLT